MKSILVAITAAAVLSACGGGGSGGTSVFDGSPASSYNVAAANHNVLTATGTWNTTGTATVSGNSVTFNATLNLSPLAAAVFPLTGTSASRTQQSLSLTSSLNSAPQTVTGITYFNPATDALLGQADTSGNCSRADGNTALPTSTAIGTKGSLYINSALSTCTSGAAVTETDTINWSLEQDGSVVLYCQNETTSSSSGTNTFNYCIQIAADGTLGSKARLTVIVPGISLSVVARNY